MINIFSHITNNILDEIDLSNLKKYVSDYYQSYFFDKSGREHYRLLSLLSFEFNNNVILDIGTHHGASAVALSFNSQNTIKSYDIQNFKKIPDFNFPKNIQFTIGDILNEKELIKKSQLIFIDVDHLGIFEKKFLDLLKEINYIGITIWDDIYLNDAMKKFWYEDCKNENKIDVSYLGHWSGTGAIIFS